MSSKIHPIFKLNTKYEWYSVIIVTPRDPISFIYHFVKSWSEICRAFSLKNLSGLIFFYGAGLCPVVAKVGGLQSQGAKGEAVVNLLRILGNIGSEVLRLSRRVNNMASNKPHPLNSPWIGNQNGDISMIFV